MRPVVVLILLTTTTTSSGCSTDVPATPTDTPAVLPEPLIFTTNEVALDTGQGGADFDPKVTVAWPGTPITNCVRLNAGSADEMTIYNADITQTEPVTKFSLQIYQFTGNALEGAAPKETLSERALDDDDEALSHRKIEHGPRKYPAIDVTAKSGDCFARRVFVVTAIAAIPEQRVVGHLQLA